MVGLASQSKDVKNITLNIDIKKQGQLFIRCMI